MGKKRAPTDLGSVEIDDDDYESVLTDVAGLLESARHAAARSVTSIMTATYWAVGRRIIEFEQAGKGRDIWNPADHTPRRRFDQEVRPRIRGR